MTLYFMRENHTFRQLPLALGPAFLMIREEVDNGDTFGSVLTDNIEDGQIPVRGRADGDKWDEFVLEATPLINRAINAAIEQEKKHE